MGSQVETCSFPPRASSPEEIEGARGLARLAPTNFTDGSTPNQSYRCTSKEMTPDVPSFGSVRLLQRRGQSREGRDTIHRVQASAAVPRPPLGLSRVPMGFPIALSRGYALNVQA